MSNNKEMLGSDSPEEKPQENPKPMSFGEFISIQRPVKDENGNVRALSDDEQEEIYSAYVQNFYTRLKSEEKYWTEIYSAYVQYFYTSKAKNAYNKETNPKPLEFDEFKRLNMEASERAKKGEGTEESSGQNPQEMSFKDFLSGNYFEFPN